MKKLEYEILIIGSGVSGLYSALKIAKRVDFKGKILIVTKCPFGESNSRYAQGGIAGAISTNISDSVSLHIDDTLKSGSGLCEKKVVNYIIANSEKTINDLVSFGAGFDRDEAGDFAYTLGGAHSAKRVLHAGEDATGMVMINALSDAVKNSPNIDIMPKSMAVKLLVKNNKCFGAVIFDKNKNGHITVYSKRIILASGGVGQVYKYTTNPYGATGDGIALAYMAGAKLRDMEFVQFHPTALALNAKTKNRYLISEALRGEGAKLVNSKGDEFMKFYSDKKELAQRDVVTRAIISEMCKENSDNVFLKISNVDKNVVLKRFPSIVKKCKNSGIDIIKDLIPVAPAAHYMIGGVEAQVNGETSIEGLYAVGEVASTGFHGANRLASNSLLECVVCAGKLAQDIELNNKIEPGDETVKKITDPPIVSTVNDLNIADLKNELKETMWNNAGIIRSEKTLSEAKNKIEKLKEKFNIERICSSADEYEFRNMLITASLIVECALSRKESRGAHYRIDFPRMNPIAEHTYINLQKENN